MDVLHSECMISGGQTGGGKCGLLFVHILGVCVLMSSCVEGVFSRELLEFIYGRVR